MSETGDRSARGDVDDDVSEASSIASSSRAAAAAAAAAAASSTELSATAGSGGGPPRSMADDAILGAGATSSSDPAHSPAPDDAGAAATSEAAGASAPRRSAVDIENLMAPDPPPSDHRPPRETILGTGMKWRNKWKARVQEWAPNYEQECGPKMNFGCCACSTLLLVIVAVFIVVPARSCSCPDGTRNCCDIENFTLAFGIMACVFLGIMSLCCMFCFAMGYASQRMQEKEQGADEVRNAVREAMV